MYRIMHCTRRRMYVFLLREEASYGPFLALYLPKTKVYLYGVQRLKP